MKVYLSPVSATALVSGACVAAKGVQVQHIGKTVAGLTAANIGARSLGIPPDLALKAPLIAGSAMAATIQLGEMYEAAKRRNFRQMFYGAARFAIGCAAAACFYAVPDDAILLAQQATALGLASIKIAQIGLKDLAKGNLKKGALELILGTASIVGTSYYLYQGLREQLSTNSLPFEKTKPAELSSFLSDHKNEIDKIYETGEETGDFRFLSSGISKATFAHPKSNYVIKIPLSSDSKWGHSENNVIENYKNMKKARAMIHQQGWNHLYIPDAYLVQSNRGSFAVEEKLIFEDAYTAFFHPLKTKAREQLDKFIKAGDYCDIFLHHNAKFLQVLPRAEPMIGIFDIDCVDIDPKNKKVESIARIKTICGSALIGIAEKAARFVGGPKKAKFILGSALLAIIGTGSYLASKGICSTASSACASSIIEFGVGTGVGTAALFTSLFAIKKLHEYGKNITLRTIN